MSGGRLMWLEQAAGSAEALPAKLLTSLRRSGGSNGLGHKQITGGRIVQFRSSRSFYAEISAPQ